jgi:hypothetical protein
LLRKLGSEWIGALVDIGNNMALLEEPRALCDERPFQGHGRNDGVSTVPLSTLLIVA